jgi:predicted P-loop ATPase
MKDVDKLPETVIEPEAAGADRKNLKVETEEKKSSKNTAIKAVNYLNDKYAFRYNLVMTELEVRPRTGGKWVMFDERMLHKLRYEMDLGAGIYVSEARFMNILYGGISADYDPLAEWIEALPKWDGRDYIGEYLQQVRLVDEVKRGYFEETFTKWLVGMIASWIVRNVVNHQMLILVGPQGRYKSTFLNNLVPADLQLDYLYCGRFDGRNKDHEKYLSTKLLINLDELATFNRVDVESLKSIITQPLVVLRKPYGRTDLRMYRRASFCGSINKTEFLTDYTGSRRFLVIEISEIVLNVRVSLEQLYSQALHLFRSGYQWWLEREEIEVIEMVNENFREHTIEEEMINEYYMVPAEGETFNVVKLTSSNIVRELADKFRRYPIDKYSAVRVGIAMGKLGFVKGTERRKGGKAARFWSVKRVDELEKVGISDPFVTG